MLPKFCFLRPSRAAAVATYYVTRVSVIAAERAVLTESEKLLAIFFRWPRRATL
jgi:hypothetical protein